MVVVENMGAYLFQVETKLIEQHVTVKGIVCADNNSEAKNIFSNTILENPMESVIEMSILRIGEAHNTSKQLVCKEIKDIAC